MDKNQPYCKSSALYSCELCDYITSRKSQYCRHLSTDKHQFRTFETEMKHLKHKKGSDDVKSSKKVPDCHCACGIHFNSRTTLWRHKKKCEQSDKSSSNEITTELVMELIKDNKELKQIIMEQNNTINNLVKNGTNNITNSLNNNNNKTFNLQFFLNETCKDAMNIMEFVDSIKVQLSDLERVGEIGYVQGLSNIITTNLKALDVTQRPVHCTDKKRKTMYIKDDNKWEKEDDNRTKMRKVIKRIANKNIKLLPEYREKNPKYSDSSSRVSDRYDKMVVEIMGGRGDNDMEKEDDIIGNILKCTTIEKYQDA
ncbi:MAG: hypothetical protein ACOVRN_00830 [Flavobacterium sp.]